MSASSTIIPATLPPIPDGMTYIAFIRPSLNMLMIGTVWTAILVPIGMALFLFSTPMLRRTPIFILNVISLAIGLAEGILNGYIEINAIICPQHPVNPATFAAFTCLCFLGPLFVESILILRLWSAFPPHRISWVQRIIVFVLPAMIKLVRLANGIVFLVQWCRKIKDIGNPLEAGQTLWGEQPWTKIEWLLQTADNLYASSLFLWRLRGNAGASGSAASSSLHKSRQSSYASTLKALLWISISNFVFPVLLSLAQVVFVFRDPSFLDGAYVFLVNNYVEIIGVLFATVWAARIRWEDGIVSSVPGTISISMPHFASPTDADMINNTGRASCLGGREVGNLGSELSSDSSEESRASSDMAFENMEGGYSKRIWGLRGLAQPD